MDVTTITIIIAIVSCGAGVANWIHNARKDTNRLAEQFTQLRTQVNHLEEQVSELKADIKILQGNVQEAIDKAVVAKQTASALHDRLDSLGVKSASQSRNE